MGGVAELLGSAWQHMLVQGHHTDTTIIRVLYYVLNMFYTPVTVIGPLDAHVGTLF
jgi:hypothetical protein